MMLKINVASARVVTMIAAVAPVVDAAALGDRARKRWSSLGGLTGAAIHLSPAGDSLVEYLQWADESSLKKAAAAVRLPYAEVPPDDLWVGDSHCVFMTPGPGQVLDNFSLSVDAADPKPTLVSILPCSAQRQDELTEYLRASAARFTTLFGGWIGAGLYPRDDGLGVTEYLQFDSFDAMAALQTRPELAAHMSHLHTFGALRAAVVMVTP